MDKVLMVMRYYEDGSDNNLMQKFESQIAAFRRIGYECNYFTITNDYYVYNSENSKTCVKKRRLGKLPFVGRVIDYSCIYSLAAKETKEEYDICYIRDCPMVLTFSKMMKKIKKNHTFIIVEIPTHPNDAELRRDKRWWIRCSVPYFKLIEKIASKYVDLFALIGTPADTYLSRPAINIVNGTNVSRYLPHKRRKTENKIHVIALAGMAHYHGFDRFIRGMHDYKIKNNNLPIYLHLVGTDVDGSLAVWKELSQKLNVDENVIVEGEKRGKELDEMFDMCDLGCGSLACHRKNTHVDFDLKSAEYLSRGIPFVTCKFSSIFPYEIPHCYSDIEENETPININEIIKFAREQMSYENATEEMRRYAEKLSWESQFKNILLKIKKEEK